MNQIQRYYMKQTGLWLDLLQDQDQKGLWQDQDQKGLWQDQDQKEKFRRLRSKNALLRLSFRRCVSHMPRIIILRLSV